MEPISVPLLHQKINWKKQQSQSWEKTKIGERKTIIVYARKFSFPLMMLVFGQHMFVSHQREERQGPKKQLQLEQEEEEETTVKVILYFKNHSTLACTFAQKGFNSVYNQVRGSVIYAALDNNAS